MVIYLLKRDRLLRNCHVVSVTDDIGTPLENYTSQQIVGDQLEASVRFAGSLEALKGREVRLQFQIRNASLYSYWFA